jgi:hypothetical protein
MPWFEWLTGERAWRVIVVLLAAGYVTQGAMFLYQAIVEGDHFVLYGVDALLPWGVLQVLAGVFFLVYFWSRPVVPGEAGE